MFQPVSSFGWRFSEGKIRKERMRETPPRRIIVDARACNGCGGCMTACLDQLRDRPKEAGECLVSRVKVLGEEPSFSLAICRQCQEAPCVDACISGALHQNESFRTVGFDGEVCVGCGMCVMNCPFGSIWLDLGKGKSAKCDLCSALDAPPCVIACSPRALRVESSSQISKEHRRFTMLSRITPDKRTSSVRASIADTESVEP